MKQTEAECLVVASEECAELTKECMKILRFGMNDKHKENLISEMGDVQCMLDLLGDHLIFLVMMSLRHPSLKEKN